ncbi:MAG TPA: rhomboid family intramembrane serine protease [Roseiflexaceae bacterium]|nr:rhomboid family intramembrane serine protease [Roseiflexaceae bacterium]
MAHDAFPAPPDPQIYGYRTYKHTCPCTREELERQIAQDKSKTIELVSALAASLVGLLFPDGAGVGSSGGILGLLGCLLVFARHRRDSFPPTLRRDRLNGTVFPAAAA